MGFERLSEHTMVSIGKNFKCNIGVIETGEYTVVVDTGHSLSDGQKVVEEIRKSQLSPVKYLIYTHYHQDHTGGAGAFGSEIEIIAQAKTHELMLAGVSRIPEHIFETEMSLSGKLVEFNLQDTGAHCPGALLVHVPSEQIIFAGDNLFQGCCPYLAEADFIKIQRILKWLLEVDPIKIVPGHGRVANRDDVELMLSYVEALIEYGQEGDRNKNFGELFLKDWAGFHQGNLESALRQFTKQIF